MSKSSLRRIETNRRNAQFSTGPKSKEGKERVRFNAIKHGILAKAAVIPGEDPNEVKALQRKIRRGLRPRGLEEEMLAEQIVVLYMGLARATRYESGLIAKQVIEAEEESIEEEEAPPQLSEAYRAALAIPTDIDGVTHLLRYETARRRGLEKAFTKLRRLQKDRRKKDQTTPGRPESG